MVKNMHKNIFFLLDVIVSTQTEKVTVLSKFINNFAIVFSISENEQ